VLLSAQQIPTAVNLGFLDRISYFFIQVVSQFSHEAEWTPFQTPYFSENLIGPEIEPRTSGSVARNSDHYTTTEAVNPTEYMRFIVNGEVRLGGGPKEEAVDSWNCESSSGSTEAGSVDQINACDHVKNWSSNAV
jgi:hypothetical protein